MKLHEAIEYVINDSGKPLSTREIADAINSTGLYRREDGKLIAPNQIAARVNNTPLLFDCTDSGLVFVKRETQIQYQRLVFQLQDLLRSYSSRNTDIIIATYVFIERVQEIYSDYTQVPSNTAYTINGRRRQVLQNIQYSTGFKLTRDDESLIGELFENINPELEIRISNLLRGYDFSLSACSHRQFGAFFNDLLNSSSITKGALGDFATPPTISKIITELANIKEGESVFDPFGGNAGVFCDIFRSKKINFTLRLNDIDKYTVWLGKMNLVLNNFTDFEYDCKDSVLDYLGTRGREQKYNWVITHPPFGGRLSKDILHGFEHSRFGPSSRAELAFLEMILSQLKHNGKAIIVVPESFLFTEDRAFINARRFLVSNSSLYAVISLPSGAFLPYTGAKASILVIDNSVEEEIKEGVHFIELSETGLKTIEETGEFSFEELKSKRTPQSIFVSNEEIEEERYSLVANRYLQRSSFSYSEEYRKLKEIVQEKFSGITYKQKILNRIDGIPYVNIKDLSDEKKFYNLNPEKIDVFVDPKTYKEDVRQKHIPPHSVLIAKIGNKLKPTLYRSKSSIAISGNILVLIPDASRISSVYLISQFYEEYVLNQVNRIRGGAVQPFVRIDDLLEIYIKVPSLEEQRDFEMKFTLDQMQNLPNKDMVEISSKEEIDLPSAIKHEYKNLKNPLSSNISNLKDFLNEKIQAKTILSWEDKIAANSGARTIQTVFTDINELMSEMSSLIDDVVTVVNLDKMGSSLTRKEVSALAYIEKVKKKIEREFQEIKISFRYIDRKEFSNIRILVDDNLFPKVVRNFILNSLKHGYEENAPEKPIDIIVSLSEDKLLFQIDLINEGRPFDDGFTFEDFISFGKKIGKNKGSGIGGFIMNQIVVHHEGTLEMIEVEKGNSQQGRINAILKTGVHFRIKLPVVK